MRRRFNYLLARGKNDDVIRTCADCGSMHTYTKLTQNCTPYDHWYRNPYEEGTWICGKCHKFRQNHGRYPTKAQLRKLREQRLNKRICHDCEGKTQIQHVGASSYHIWHHHPEIKYAWLCATCYANATTPQKRNSKLTKRGTSTKNSVGLQILCMVSICTVEHILLKETRKCQRAVTIWGASHPEHYKEMGIRGALKAREMGLGGLPTKLEKAMENALKKNHIRYLPQYPFNIGIMDFYLPDAKIALFVDGTIWHADPRVYKAEDVLFFSRNTRDVVSSKLTAKEVWLKDRRQNAYLKKNGFIVMRFWEKEIKENIEKCIQAIRLKLRPKR